MEATTDGAGDAGAVVARGGVVGAVAAAAHAPAANDGVMMSIALSRGGHQPHRLPPLHRSGCVNRTSG